MTLFFSWLLQVLLALTLLAIPPACAVSISTNDPFRAIVLQHHALHPQPPLCCLKPLPSADPPEGPEDILLSFEEWKLKQFQAHSQIPAQVTSSARTETSDGHTVGSQDAHHSTPPADVPSPSQDHSYARDSVPPHFRVPITDRFNYANMDCSARVHMAHKSAKSASSILSSKKDWYMLSPCCKNGEAQFVVVELCDDIRIDTVQLANFEFFSGVFKDFTVRVAKTYPASEDGWTFAGTYRARNVRGVQVCLLLGCGVTWLHDILQSFHPPTSLRDFYRYIRIDFHSHYGHEYYCPISLLRVYGLTHLEQWKWDIWEAESRARLQEQRPLIADATQASTNLVQQPSSTDDIHAFMDILESGSMNTSTAPQTKASSSSQKRSTPQTIDSSSSTGPMTASPSSAPVIVHDQLLSITHRVEEESPHVTPSTPPSSLVDTMSSIASIMSHSTSFTTTLNQPTSELSHHRPPESPTSLAASSTRTPSLSVSFDMPSSAAYSTMHSPIPSGESIFGAIMNRLTILEANHTLYVRYVEEQLAGVREVLKKLGEEVGRLESIVSQPIYQTMDRH
ncbi:hypothetical protein ID866_1717 [Astraeus odoratus]|nr:hypothetical protein ID866_1717 [Astraeus odoratus]